MKKLIESIVFSIISSLIKILKPHQIEKVADKALDWCENAIEKTETEYDNKIILPLIKLIREAFNIEDND